jgi:hypothetical protein
MYPPSVGVTMLKSHCMHHSSVTETDHDITGVTPPKIQIASQHDEEQVDQSILKTEFTSTYSPH